MFIDPNELIEIKVFYKRTGRHYIVSTEEDYDMLEEEGKSAYKCLIVKVRELTWGLYNELNEEAVVKDGAGGRQWNYKLYKENKLKKVLVSWDAKKTIEGKEPMPIAVTAETIGKLAPDIAESILSSYDTIMFIDEDEEKK